MADVAACRIERQARSASGRTGRPSLKSCGACWQAALGRIWYPHLDHRLEEYPMRGAVACLIAVAGFALTAFAKDDYQLGPDSMEQKDVPRGKVSKHTWKSNVFPDTVRDYWVYVPAQIDPKEPACVMIFQDVGSYVDPTCIFRVPTVFDNLIEKKDIPLLVGIFINPGKGPA